MSKNLPITRPWAVKNTRDKIKIDMANDSHEIRIEIAKECHASIQKDKHIQQNQAPVFRNKCDDDIVTFRWIWETSQVRQSYCHHLDLHNTGPLAY